MIQHGKDNKERFVRLTDKSLLIELPSNNRMQVFIMQVYFLQVYNIHFAGKVVVCLVMNEEEKNVRIRVEKTV